jgi:hypothetical protein
MFDGPLGWTVQILQLGSVPHSASPPVQALYPPSVKTLLEHCAKYALVPFLRGNRLAGMTRPTSRRVPGREVSCSDRYEWVSPSHHIGS